MKARSIEAKIRTAAQSKVKVRITNRKRSKNGFLVKYPDGRFYYAHTKSEALQNMLATTRCFQTHEFTLSPATDEEVKKAVEQARAKLAQTVASKAPHVPFFKSNK